MNSLQRVGTERIEHRDVPVFQAPNGRRYVKQQLPSGDIYLVSVEGARLLKNKPYPLHPSIQSAVSTEIFGDVPLVLQSKAARHNAANRVLEAIMGRMRATGAPLQFSVR